MMVRLGKKAGILPMLAGKGCQQANAEMWLAFIKSGRKDRSLRDALCQTHFGLAQTFAREYARERRLNFDDTMSSACEGLLFAIGDYDPSTGPFRPFARWCMKLALRNPARAESRRRTEALASRGSPQSDVLPDTTADDRELAEHLLSCLGERHQRIVRWHLYEGLTYVEIASREDCSASRICSLFNDAIQRMKEVAKNGDQR